MKPWPTFCRLQKSLEATAQLTSANAVLVKDSIYSSIVDGYEAQLKEQLDGSLIASGDIAAGEPEHHPQLWVV